MSRREYGTGGMSQRRADWRWVGTIEAGWTATGARRRVVVTSKGCVGGCEARCAHRAQIKRKLRDKRLAIERDGASPVVGRMTVRKWAEAWLEITATQIRPQSWATDAAAVRKWIIPTIGHKQLNQLTPGDVRAVATAQRNAGRVSSTARRTQTTLTGMLRAAMVEGHQVPARVLLVRPPALSSTDRDAMTVSQMLAVLEVASRLPHGSRWAVSFLHGMRQGECLGLTWDAIDWEAGQVVVEWQLQSLPYQRPRDRSSGFRVPDGFEARQLVDGYHLTRPKTRRGFRVIPLVPGMATALRAWREVAPANPWGLVWPAADGQPASCRDDREEWYALQGTAGVSHPAGRYFYTHEARHTTATQLMELGIDEHVITAILGHSSIVTSRGYMHANQQHAREALAGVAARLQLEGR